MRPSADTVSLGAELRELAEREEQLQRHAAPDSAAWHLHAGRAEAYRIAMQRVFELSDQFAARERIGWGA